MAFPELRSHYGKGKSYAGDIWKYAQRWGFRILNDLRHVTGHAHPTADALAELFAEAVIRQGVTWHPMDAMNGAGGKRSGMNLDDVCGEAERAAAAVLRDWDPEYITRQAARGAPGGMKSKRPSDWTPQRLARLERLQREGLTIAQLAKRMGVSERSISRGRVKLRELGQALDALLDSGQAGTPVE